MPMTKKSIPTTHAGYIALIGRPNVGKSTLLNRLIGQKLSITASKPQTTRHTLFGIQTLPEIQIVYIDTPGLHISSKKAMNRYLNRAAASVLSYADVAIFLVEALRWTEEDEYVLKRLAEFVGVVVLAVNKIDRITDKSRLLPFLEHITRKRDFTEVVPISGLKGNNLDVLKKISSRLLPVGDYLFPVHQRTNASEYFLAAELIREQLTRILRDELPYALSVEVEQFVKERNVVHILAVIWVERETQKRIVIGKNGIVLREVGRHAREAMERLFTRKVFLKTWVKVRGGWSDDEQSLCRLGYTNFTD
jgi:GTP-binding protein Era